MTDEIEILEPNKNIWPPVDMRWIDDVDADSSSLVFTASTVKLFSICKINTAFFFCKPVYKYRLCSPLMNPDRLSLIGGHFDTLDEAISAGEKYATIIIRGNNFVRPGNNE